MSASSGPTQTRVLALAAAVVVVFTVFWLSMQKGSPAEMLEQLEQPSAESVRFQFVARGSLGGVLGYWDRGKGAQRLLGLHDSLIPRKSRKLLRDRAGVSYYRVEKAASPRSSREWIGWVEAGQTVVPLRSPREWLIQLARTYDLRWAGPARILGDQRSEDPLQPKRFEVTIDTDRKVIERLTLIWSTPGGVPAGARRALRQPLRFLTKPPQLGETTRPPSIFWFQRSGPQTHPRWWFTIKNL